VWINTSLNTQALSALVPEKKRMTRSGMLLHAGLVPDEQNHIITKFHSLHATADRSSMAEQTTVDPAMSFGILLNFSMKYLIVTLSDIEDRPTSATNSKVCI
jgi:hypothetical protein